MDELSPDETGSVGACIEGGRDDFLRLKSLMSEKICNESAGTDAVAATTDRGKEWCNTPCNIAGFLFFRRFFFF